MKKQIILIILILFFCKTSTIAQVKFRMDFRKSNPIQTPSDYNSQQIIKIHEKYLKKAFEEKNIKQQFYGQLFLYGDYMNNGLYIEAAKYMVEAEKLAKISRNCVWLADLSTKKGFFDIEVHKDHGKALLHHKTALMYALKGTDSLCIGEVYEQISALYSQKKDFVNAKKYFDLALPLIKRHGDNLSLGITYSNYSNFWHFQNKFNEAIQYYDSAIFYARKSKHLFNEMKWKINLTSLYVDKQDYLQAIAIGVEAEPILSKNSYKYLLAICYDNLAMSYEAIGNYKASNYYYIKHFALDDSLNGAKVQNKLATLASKMELAQKEIALKTAKIALQKRNFQIILFGLAFVFFLLFWLFQTRKNKRKLKHNQESLNDLTKILLEKNSLLSEMEGIIHKKKSETNTSVQNGFVENLYDGKILTNQDWELFKAKFERVFPNFIYRLRQKFDLISEAEERLFVFIKLKLKSKEIASILGINADSIKRTRNRLRKRLELTEDENLDEFIHRF